MLKQLREDEYQPAPMIIELSNGDQFRVLGQDYIDPKLWKAGGHPPLCEETAERETFKKVTDVRRGEDLVVMPIKPSPMNEDAVARLVAQVARDRRVGGIVRAESDIVRLERTDEQSFTFSVHARTPACLDRISAPARSAISG